jgi:hypothetical protein
MYSDRRSGKDSHMVGLMVLLEDKDTRCTFMNKVQIVRVKGF